MTLQAPDLDQSLLVSTPQPAPRSRLRSLLVRLGCESAGQDVIEYALAAALIGLTSVSSMNGLAVNISNAFDHIGSAVTSSIPAGSGASNNSPGNNNNGGNRSGRRGGRRGGGGFGGFGGFRRRHG